MYKKILSALSIVALLSITGCQSDVKLGQFLGELACLTAQTSGTMTLEEIDSIGDANGFDGEAEVTDEINRLSEAELDAQLVIAMDHIEGTCTADFEAAEVDPKAFLDDFISSFMTLEPEEETTEEVAEEEILKVSAVELAKAYEENEVKADIDYKDMDAEISGVIDDIGVVLSQTYITLSSGEEFALTNVQCFFDDKVEIEKVAELKKGDTVTVQGNIEGKSMNVAVKNCMLK